MRPGHRPIRSVFIANRGEIAARIAGRAGASGSSAIAPPTDGPGALDLLDVERGRRRGRSGRRRRASTRASGSWPRTPTFAEAVVAAGIAWVGPPPGAIRAMGDKAAARRLARLARRPGPRRLRRRRPVRRGADRRRRTHRLPAPGQAGRPAAAARACGPSARPIGLADALAAARREAMAAVRRRPADPRAARRGRPPRRDPGPVRRRRARASSSASATARSSGATRRSSRRRRRRRSTTRCADRLGEAALALGRRRRLRRRRDVRVPARRPRRPSASSR